jgi:anti-sigma-K factor RskA
MDTAAYINSGILELYVFGTLSETESQEVTKIAAEFPEIQNEIISIEKAIISLSYSVSPSLSIANFEKIKAKLIEKHQEVVQLKPRTNAWTYMGWAAAVLLLIGSGYFYDLNNKNSLKIVAINEEKSKLKSDIDKLNLKNQQSEKVLAVVRDEGNTIITLAGQAVSPTSTAKIYWNKTTQTVFVDATGLPTPPEGKEYQIWSLKLLPQLTPTSIGTLANFSENSNKIFEVENTSGAEAFGITLEPKGGSPTPTMEQLYTLGKV